jgi:hypothetical protein
LSETTPGFNPNSSENRAQNSTLEPASTNTTGVDLAPVVISPSPMLWRIQMLMYSLMLLFASIAILPFIFTAFYWPMLWLSFVLVLLLAVRSAWHKKHELPIRLSVTRKQWRLQTSAGELQVEPCAEILLWNAVIVLPVREVITKRKHRIVALSDSMNADDWRRLRVWLRMGLRNNL